MHMQRWRCEGRTTPALLSQPLTWLPLACDCSMLELGLAALATEAEAAQVQIATP